MTTPSDVKVTGQVPETLPDFCKVWNNLPPAGSGVWTRDVTKAHQLARALCAGSVWISCDQPMDPAVPFGGYKMRGYGRESSQQHVREYLDVKAVWIKAA